MFSRKKTLVIKDYFVPPRLLRAHRVVHSTGSVRNTILKSRDLEIHSSPKREYHKLDLKIVYKFVVNTVEPHLKI